MTMFLLPLKTRRGVIYALLALAEAGWLGALLMMQVAGDGFQVSPWFFTLLGAVSLAILLGWFSDVYQMPLESARVLGMILAVLMWLALLKATLYPDVHLWQLGWFGQFIRDASSDGTTRMSAVWVGVATAYIWWRCLTVGHTLPEASLAKFTLKAGVVGFTVAFILADIHPDLAPPLSLLLLFVFGGLLAMNFSHTETITDFHGDAAAGRWGTRVTNNFAITIAIVIIAIILASVFSLSLLDKISTLFVYFLQLIAAPVLAFILWLFNLIEPYLERFLDWLNAYLADPNAVTPTPEATAAANTAAENFAGNEPTSPVWWAGYTIWLWRVLAVTVILWIFYRFTGTLGDRFRNPNAGQATVASGQESLSPEKREGQSWLDKGKARLADLANMVRQFGIGKDLRAAATIRRIYAALMVLVAHYGLERAPSETPLEFLNRLLARWESLTEPLSVITNAYINVHYGQLPEGRAGADAVRRAWDEVYETVQELDKSAK